MDKRGLIQFYQNLVTPQMERENGKGKRQLDLFPFSLFLAYQLYSCAATRLSQEVITVNLPFNCKIFLQFHPVSEISEMRNERI